MKWSGNLWRGFTTVMAGLLTVSIGAGTICETWKDSLDQNLGTISSIIQTSDKSGDDTYTYTSDYSSTEELVDALEEFNEQVQEEGSVLLKNNGALPLESGTSVTLFGTTSHYPYYGAQMGGTSNEDAAISLEQALEDEGFLVNPVMTELYETLGSIATGTTTNWLGQEEDVYGYQPGTLAQTFIGPVEGTYSVGEPPLSAYEEADPDYAESFAEYGDAAIVVVGRSGSEGADYIPGEEGLSEGESGTTALALNEEERAMIALACENFDKVIVLINAVNQLEIEELEENDDIDAILWIGYPGSYGFTGVADILSGETSPSGHLSVTYAVDSTSSPAMMNYGNIYYTNGTDDSDSMYVVEAEGIYIGYRYYETRYSDLITGDGNADSTAGSSTGEAWSYEDEVTYSFGYGLSYTEFRQTLDAVEMTEDSITVTVTIANVGDAAGKDVAQIYIQTPYTDYDREYLVEKSAVQLIDYAKTDVLEPGESQTLTITFDKSDFASYDSNGAGTYIMDAGDYYLALGNGAHDALNNILAAQGYTTEDGMDYDGDAALTYTWNQEELDTTTYSVSSTGAEITNQLEDMDLNYWQPGTVTYLSRQDWEGTWPITYTDITITEEMEPYMDTDFYVIETDEDTSDIFPEEDNGISFLDMAGADFDDERWDDLLDQLSLEEAIYGIRVGGTKPKDYNSVDMIVDAFESDGPTGVQSTLVSSQDDPDSPTYVSEDDEYADYASNVMTAESVLASAFNKELAEEEGRMFGEESLWSNITIFFAPGLNLIRTPYNGRNEEYYSEDATLAMYTGGAVIAGATEKGCLITAKHMAFNDQESGRCGLSVFMTEQRARETELRVFEEAVESGVLAIMTSMNRMGITYSSAHVGMMQNILRDEWGYEGFLMTDILMSGFSSYMNVKESVIGGTTLMGISSDTLAGDGGDWEYFTVEGISGDRDLVQAVRDNTKYLFYALANSNAMNGINSTSTVVNQMTWWRWAYVGAIGVTLALTLLGAVMYILSIRRRKERES